MTKLSAAATAAANFHSSKSAKTIGITGSPFFRRNIQQQRHLSVMPSLLHCLYLTPAGMFDHHFFGQNSNHDKKPLSRIQPLVPSHSSLPISFVLSHRRLSLTMPVSSVLRPIDEDSTTFTDQFLKALRLNSSLQPDKPCLIDAKNPDDSLTYNQLEQRGHSIAAFLVGQQFEQGDIACLVLPNCWEYIAIFLGVILRGGVISGANAIFTSRELRQQFNDSRAKVIFCTDQSLHSVLDAISTVEQSSLSAGSEGKPPTVTTIVVLRRHFSKFEKATKDTATNASKTNIAENGPSFGASYKLFDFNKDVLTVTPYEQRPEGTSNAGGNDVLLLPYSSGTTGPPKGVMTTHKNFGTMMDTFCRHFDEEIYRHFDPPYIHQVEHKLLILPFYHCYGFGSVISCLLNGSTGIILNGFDQHLFCGAIQKYKVRVLLIVPPILLFLAKGGASGYDLSSVWLVMTGAAPAGRDICDELKRRHPHIRHVVQGYGMTEATMATHLPVIGQPLDAVGKIVDCLEMRIDPVNTEVNPVNSKPPDDNNRAAEGRLGTSRYGSGPLGEVLVRGPTVMRGYFGRPESTALTIDPDGWLHTGDIGYTDSNGLLYIVDRIKELIKVKGFQVAPAELEALLLSHSDIQDCAVIGVPDQSYGEVPKAFIVPVAGAQLTPNDVKLFVKERVSSYKHLRGGVTFVDCIPKSPSGKILRRILRTIDREDQIRMVPFPK